MVSRTQDQEEELEGEKINVKVSIEIGDPKKNSLFSQKLEEMLPLVEIIPINMAIYRDEPLGFILGIDCWVRLMNKFPVLELLHEFPKHSFYIIDTSPDEHIEQDHNIEGRIFFVPSIEELVKLLE